MASASQRMASLFQDKMDEDQNEDDVTHPLVLDLGDRTSQSIERQMKLASSEDVKDKLKQLAEKYEYAPNGQEMTLLLIKNIEITRQSLVGQRRRLDLFQQKADCSKKATDLEIESDIITKCIASLIIEIVDEINFGQEHNIEEQKNEASLTMNFKTIINTKISSLAEV